MLLTGESSLRSWGVPTSTQQDVLAGVSPSGNGQARFEARREGTAVISVSRDCPTEPVNPMCRGVVEPWRVTVHVLPSS